MYFTVAQLRLIRYRMLLNTAQIELHAARSWGDPRHMVRCEAHVLRMLNYVWNAQEQVRAEVQGKAKQREDMVRWMTDARYGTPFPESLRKEVAVHNQGEYV